MKENKKEEVQSRREFFKSAAKKALPILGAIALTQLPFVAKSHENQIIHDCDYNCANGCYGGCAGSCEGTCSGSCENECNTSCYGTCRGSCEGNCGDLCK